MALRGRLDRILVIDIEATCWDGPIPVGQENEIIEIGLCIFDVASGLRSEKRSLLVRPERSQVSPFCTQLTSLTQAQVEQGLSFTEACKVLQRDYDAKAYVWSSYGDYDRVLFEQQCQQRQVEYPFSSRHVNIKTLFALAHGLKREVGLATALSIIQVAFEGTHHRGVDDAWNTAAVLGEVLQRFKK